MRVMIAALVLALALATAAAGQQSLPLAVTVRYAGGRSDTVEVRGTTEPGTVVSVRGATKVVDESGEFALATKLPVNLVAVKGGQIRRLSLSLPSGATKWLSWLTVNANLTQMKALIAGALTISNHPSATVTVEHVQAGKTVEAMIDHGQFKVGLPMVPQVNTLDWTLHAGWLSWTAPSLSFSVQ